MAKHDNKCRSCVYYDLPAVQNRAGAVLSHQTARCMWKPTSIIDFEDMFPSSVRRTYGYRSAMTTLTNEHQQRMEPNDGSSCKQWERRA